jgi:hypothetical protein
MVGETFHDFRSLSFEEVRDRAERIEKRRSSRTRSRDERPPSYWRRLHREMRRARASTVANLKPHVVETYAARLGYGYLRVRYTRRGAFMPFPGR